MDQEWELERICRRSKRQGVSWQQGDVVSTPITIQDYRVHPKQGSRQRSKGHIPS